MAKNLNLGPKQSKSKLAESTGFIRVYRYPPCSLGDEAWGMMAHTDSSVLSIVNQDQVGGLEIFKDNKWLLVNPIPNTLVVHIGDMMQVYKILPEFFLLKFSLMLKILLYFSLKYCDLGYKRRRIHQCETQSESEQGGAVLNLLLCIPSRRQCDPQLEIQTFYLHRLPRTSAKRHQDSRI